jgi:hypothetical protein
MLTVLIAILTLMTAPNNDPDGLSGGAEIPVEGRTIPSGYASGQPIARLNPDLLLWSDGRLASGEGDTSDGTVVARQYNQPQRVGDELISCGIVDLKHPLELEQVGQLRCTAWSLRDGASRTVLTTNAVVMTVHDFEIASNLIVIAAGVPHGSPRAFIGDMRTGKLVANISLPVAPVSRIAVVYDGRFNLVHSGSSAGGSKGIGVLPLDLRDVRRPSLAAARSIDVAFPVRAIRHVHRNGSSEGRILEVMRSYPERDAVFLVETPGGKVEVRYLGEGFDIAPDVGGRAATSTGLARFGLRSSSLRALEVVEFPSGKIRHTEISSRCNAAPESIRSTWKAQPFNTNDGQMEFVISERASQARLCHTTVRFPER